MRRLALALVLGILVFAGGRAIWRALASDETRIRWVLADEVAAFNGASLLAVMPHFAPDYRDGGGVDRQMLAGGVVWAWQNRRDGDGRFAWHVELPAANADGVELAIAGDKATATFALELHAGHGDAAKPLWQLRVVAGLERRDGEWWIVQSSHRTTGGQSPK